MQYELNQLKWTCCLCDSAINPDKQYVIINDYKQICVTCVNDHEKIKKNIRMDYRIIRLQDEKRELDRKSDLFMIWSSILFCAAFGLAIFLNIWFYHWLNNV